VAGGTKHAEEPLSFLKCGEFLDESSNYQLLNGSVLLGFL
jgi:hypothetical protein